MDIEGEEENGSRALLKVTVDAGAPLGASAYSVFESFEDNVAQE